VSACPAPRPAAFARTLATLMTVACVLSAPASAATTGIVYKGRTSQDKPIRLTIAAGHVKNLRFTIVIACASHHRYSGPVWGFSAIAIKGGRFSVAVTSHAPKAKATVSGRVGSHRVRGSVHLRRYVAPEHGFCTGSATFDLKRPG
jgi:hypothetical protein